MLSRSHRLGFTLANSTPTIQDHETEITSLWVNVKQLQARVRYLEKVIDTRSTPLWRRVWFRLDGWPSWTVVATKEQRSWRPWHGK